MHDLIEALNRARDTGQPLTLLDAHVPACLLHGVGEPLSPDEDGVVAVDLTLEAGRVTAICAHQPDAPLAGEVLALRGRMVWPCFVDVHTHLDKGHIWPRRRNPDGTFMSALETVRQDREAHWSAADVRARFEFGLRCAHAHGTAAIRTHLDSSAPQDAISWDVFGELRAAWRGRIELQAVCLVTLDEMLGARGSELADRVAEHGGVLGGVPMMNPELDAQLDAAFRLAAERGLELDFHVDETGDPGAQTFRHIAEAKRRHGFAGQVLCGHVCALSRQDPHAQEATLRLAAKAGLSVVTLPMCNLYLQDRAHGRTPQWRGVTLVHEMIRHGIPVMTASDNCRDPFYAYGDHDMLEVFRQTVRIAHADHPFDTWPRAVTKTPAAFMGVEGYTGTLAVGGAANLIVFRARNFSELLSRAQGDRVVVRDGAAIDTVLPDYAELDEVLRRAPAGSPVTA